MNDEDSTAASAPTPPDRGLSRRAVLFGAAGVAAAAVFADITGFSRGLAPGGSGGGTPAQAAGEPAEPRHGAGEWTEDPPQSSLSQSRTPVRGDIEAMPLDRSL